MKQLLNKDLSQNEGQFYTYAYNTLYLDCFTFWKLLCILKKGIIYPNSNEYAWARVIFFY